MTEPVAGPPADQPSVDDERSDGVSAAGAAERRLAELDGAPLEQHVEVYEDVHRRLQEGLADLDER